MLKDNKMLLKHVFLTTEYAQQPFSSDFILCSLSNYQNLPFECVLRLKKLLQGPFRSYETSSHGLAFAKKLS